MDQEKLIEIIQSVAQDCGLDPNLVLAIAYVESGLDTTKVRYEPNWKYPLSPEKYASRLGITAETERVLQSMSWGALQVMGATSRVCGYNGMLTLLIQPSLGVLYGCKYLQMLNKKYPLEKDLISAYNAGCVTKVDGEYKNNLYVIKVTGRLSYLRKVHLS